MRFWALGSAGFIRQTRSLFECKPRHSYAGPGQVAKAHILIV